MPGFHKLPRYKGGKFLLCQRCSAGKTVVFLLAYISLVLQHSPERLHIFLPIGLYRVFVALFPVTDFFHEHAVIDAVVLDSRLRENMIDIVIAVEPFKTYFLARIHTFTELRIVKIQSVPPQIAFVRRLDSLIQLGIFIPACLIKPQKPFPARNRCFFGIIAFAVSRNLDHYFFRCGFFDIGYFIDYFHGLQQAALYRGRNVHILNHFPQGFPLPAFFL